MIVVKVELWPFGDKDRAQELGRTFIWNTGSGTASTGNYGVAVMQKGTHEVDAPQEGKVLRDGKVEDYPRLSYNVWRLVIRALRSAFIEEK